MSSVGSGVNVGVDVKVGDGVNVEVCVSVGVLVGTLETIGTGVFIVEIWEVAVGVIVAEASPATSDSPKGEHPLTKINTLQHKRTSLLNCFITRLSVFIPDIYAGLHLPSPAYAYLPNYE
ncbi:hypothetical protein ACFLZW_03635 [Chloroflexota bacterium]